MGVPVEALGLSTDIGHYELGMGWLRDLPDLRDYTLRTREVADVLGQLKLLNVAPSILPASVDLRRWCPVVENQGALGSCTANAGVGLLEYFERRVSGKWIDASRLFLYKTTRKLMGVRGDAGADIRTTMGAMRLFGVPPETYWPYEIAKFDAEPSAFCYSFGKNYKTLRYYRLDPPGTLPQSLLTNIKTNLAAGFPLAFGFTVYSSISTAAASGKIPYPSKGEKTLGGHAVDAVGYDDLIRIENGSSGKETTGALLIRNSWGDMWGSAGYGWLPYDYILMGLATDLWTVVTAEWVDTGEFGIC
jgi:C1A family cysteine protease